MTSVEHLDVLAVVASQSRLARLVAHHIRQRVVGLPHLGRMLRRPLAKALADHRRAAMDTDHSALTRQQFQHLVGHADARHRLHRDVARKKGRADLLASWVVGCAFGNCTFAPAAMHTRCPERVKKRQKTMSAVTAASAESGHGAPRQHACQRRAVARCVMLAVAPSDERTPALERRGLRCYRSGASLCYNALMTDKSSTIPPRPPLVLPPKLPRRDSREGWHRNGDRRGAGRSPRVSPTSDARPPECLSHP